MKAWRWLAQSVPLWRNTDVIGSDAFFLDLAVIKSLMRIDTNRCDDINNTWEVR